MAKEIIWTEDKIEEGFKKFAVEYGHPPTSLEIDKYPHLPSSRQLQRRFGGLPNIRGKLGLNITDYTKGEIRSQVAQAMAERGLTLEKHIKQLLFRYFGPMFVHEQKPVSDFGRTRLDFFVYAKSMYF